MREGEGGHEQSLGKSFKTLMIAYLTSTSTKSHPARHTKKQVNYIQYMLGAKHASTLYTDDPWIVLCLRNPGITLAVCRRLS